MIGVGLIGCGAWGFNYLKMMNTMPEAKLVCVCDLNEDTLNKTSLYYPHLKTTRTYRDLLKNDQVKGVIIATPPDTHLSIAADFLSHNKAVLIEKPITLSYSEAVTLIKLAEKNNNILMVGHLMEYHPVVVKLHEYINHGLLGQIRYISLERTSLGKNRNDILWDLAVHDLSIVRYLVNKNPLWVSSQGKSFLNDGLHDLVTINMEFPSDLYVQIHVNSIYPEKIRQTVVAGDRIAAIFDDTRGNFKLKLIPFKGDIILPDLDNTPPLTIQCRHFIQCIKTNSRPKTGSRDIIWVMKAMELIQKSLLKSGERYYFNQADGDYDENKKV